MRASQHNPSTELHNLPEHNHEVAAASRSKESHLTSTELNEKERVDERAAIQKHSDSSRHSGSHKQAKRR